MAIATKSAGEPTVRLPADYERPTAVRPTDRKLVVIAGRCGRMANRLVLFANFIALAEEQGHRLINPTFHSYAELFQVTSGDIYCQYPIINRKSLFDIVPGAASAIRSTRIFFHAVHAARGMRKWAAQFRACKVPFVVCSDEARNGGEFPGLVVGFGAGSPVGDFCALARCDYIFGPVTTFSQGASFSGHKPLYHLHDGNARLERSQFRVSDLREIP